MRKKSFYFEIFAVSLAAILLEVTYTRIFSFKIWYFFTYLVIGVSLLGLGTGGVVVAISGRLRQADPARLIPKMCFLGGACVFIGYSIIARTQLNISEIGLAPSIEIPKLVIVSLLLMLPFLATGIIVSTILGSRPEHASKLYAADLLGAALGCIACIPLLVMLDPPRTAVLAGLVFSLSGFRLSLRSRWLFGFGGAISAVLLLALVTGRMLPVLVADKMKSYEPLREKGLVRFTKWHPVFRVDVVGYPDKSGHLYILLHDGHAGSSLRRFDGDLSALGHLHNDVRALPFAVLPEKPKVLIIGSAGGREILASLFFGASHVTGVELNPITVSLLTDTYADFTGFLHKNTRVTLVNGEGRWFMSQSEEKYDLIWFVAPDTYAAMNASSAAGFVLAESYLYTVEMLKESLEHLSEQGVICAQFGELNYEHKHNRTTRYLATARRAFAKQNIENFERHVAVSSSSDIQISLATVMLSRSSLTFDQINRFQEMTTRLPKGKVRYLPGRPTDDFSVNQVIALHESQLEGWFEDYRYMVDPVYDDSPYFWHFARFRDALTSPLNLGSTVIDGVGYRSVDSEDSIAERVSFILLVVVVIFAAFFLFLPFAVIHKVWIEIPYKARSGVYFASLGLGFMFMEVVLIQMLTLFLGYPTRSLSVTLFGLLVFSGLGSFLSQRYTARRNRALGILMAALIVLVMFYQFGLPVIVDRFIAQPIAVRIVLTIAMIAPLGLCLGAFMPVGLTTIAQTTDHKREYVAWAWAVNGFFSVMASVLATILAMVIGFKMVFLLALVIYAAGILSLTRLPQDAGERS